MKAALEKLPTPEKTNDLADAVNEAIMDAADIDGVSPTGLIRALEGQGLCIVSIPERSLMLLGAPTPHDWIKSTLGHGETMCSRCKITNREAAVLGKMDVCDDGQGTQS